MSAKFEIVTDNGAVVEIPLNRLKKSPANARRTPHSEADIEARAASIAAKGIIQPLVVAPEFDRETPTGYYFVTVGESRRQAQLLRAKRKEIGKAEPVRCIIDTLNDPHEISLDENVNRTGMHPADEFEAFKKVADDHGWGAEEIAARFGVTPHVVRQRMRLGAVSPKLIALYREEQLSLDQLMAFAVTDDHRRQEQVLESLSPFNRQPYAIRRAMTEAKVHADDRRARFVGYEAYEAAGGTLLRDLFVEDHGGWFEDVGLLDRLVAEKLDAIAEQVKAEGWKWVEAYSDFPHGAMLRRVYPSPVERAPEDAAKIAALSQEYDGVLEKWDSAEALPAEVEARLAEIEAELETFGELIAYAQADIAVAGAFVVLGSDGVARIERGFVRPEDEPARDPETEMIGGRGGEHDGGAEAEGDAKPGGGEDGEEADGLAPLPDRLVAELSAYRTAGLRVALGDRPDLALTAVVHAIALPAFYPCAIGPNCLEIKTIRTTLGGDSPGLGESPAIQAVAERHGQWARRLPSEADALWGHLMTLSASELLDLLAHCASLTVNAVQQPWERKPAVMAHADVLARALDLDMVKFWSPTRESYFDRVTKARIVEAVADGVGADAAGRLNGLKKPDMAQEAEGLMKGSGWLPPMLRRPEVEEPQGAAEAPAMAAE